MTRLSLEDPERQRPAPACEAQTMDDFPMEVVNSSATGSTHKRSRGGSDAEKALVERKTRTRLTAPENLNRLIPAEGAPTRPLDLYWTFLVVDTLMEAVSGWGSESGESDLRFDLVDQLQSTNAFQSLALEISMSSHGSPESRWDWTPRSYMNCFEAFRKAAADLTDEQFGMEAVQITDWVDRFVRQVEFETKVCSLFPIYPSDEAAYAFLGSLRPSRLHLTGLYEATYGVTLRRASSQSDASC
jgi:hypothetical protein